MNKNLLTIVILLALVGSITNVNTAHRKRKAGNEEDGFHSKRPQDQQPPTTETAQLAEAAEPATQQDAHNEEINAATQYKCPVCVYSAPYSSHLTIHMRIHTGERPFQCPVKGCSYSAAHKSNLTRHIQVKHAAAKDHNQIELDITATPDESVATQTLLMLSGAAANNAHEDDNTPLHDEEDGFHSKRPQDQQPPTTKTAQLAEAAEPATKQDSHNEEMNAATQYKCPVCVYSTAKKSNLTRHTRIHTGENLFKCAVKDCPYATTDQSNLTAHMRIHKRKASTCHSSDEEMNAATQQHKCPVCGYSTAKQSNLTRHMRIHTGDNPFKCPVEDCDHSTTDRSGFTRHMRTHTDEKPFKCPVKGCFHKTAQKYNLIPHIQRKHAAAAAADNESEAKQALPMLAGAAVTNEDDNTQLHVAAMEEDAEVVQTILATQNINVIDQDGRTALHRAVEFGYTAIVHILLAHGINVNATDDFNGTALHIAVLRDHKEIAQILLNAPEINVNATDFLGYTALHLAALLGRTEVVQALLACGADTTLALIDGSTAADLALTEEICHLILDAAARQQ